MSVSFLHRVDEQPDWAASIVPELQMVERALEEVVYSDVLPALDLSMNLLRAGGKRIRPSLMILSAMASGECDPQRLVNLAAAAELVHMASLVHDDVVDETHERRGASTANESWGNKVSVLGGDYLLSKSFLLLAENANSEIMHILSTTAVRMTESEILQASGEGDLAVWETDYWRIIRDKTAVFLGACCECGAILACANTGTRELLREYGVHLGLAFQITDDILDIAGDRAITGKETGTDLMHGKFTLPVLLALRDSDQSGDLRAMLTKGRLTRSEAQEVAVKVAETGAVEAARAAASDCAEKARRKLSNLTPSEHVKALDALAKFVIARQS